MIMSTTDDCDTFLDQLIENIIAVSYSMQFNFPMNLYRLYAT